MNTLMDTLLNKADQAITQVGLLNKLVDTAVSWMAPTTKAAAGCTNIYCSQYCQKKGYCVAGWASGVQTFVYRANAAGQLCDCLIETIIWCPYRC